MTIPGLIIAAPGSGSGKTTVTLGLLRALRRQGIAAASAKAGPDYIDPAFHAAASGRPCRNLDGWGMRPETLAAQISAASDSADLVIVEGVMGLFDGASDGTGSTADLAALLGWPIVLVIDIWGQGVSAAAVASGFARFRSDVEVSAVILNRVGSPGHAAMVRNAIAAIGLPVIGALPRDPALALPERHLGLIQAAEHGDLERFIERAADACAQAIDLAALQQLARPSANSHASDNSPPIPPLGQRIAIARDQAFAFVYPHLLDGWRAAGCELALFSPLAGEGPDADADAVYLPGGYPELHAGRIAAATHFLDGLRRAADRGAAIYGECGGYMALGRLLTDADGVAHAMAGLLPVETSFAKRRLHLGYRRIETLRDSPFGPAGARFRGHEFHYSSAEEDPDCPALFQTVDTNGNSGRAGLTLGNVHGSYLHLIDRV